MLQRDGDASVRASGSLVREPDASGVAVMHAVRRHAGVPLARFMPGVIGALRERGDTRLQVWTLKEAVFASDLRHAGFILRERAAPVLGSALTSLREAVGCSPRNCGRSSAWIATTEVLRAGRRHTLRARDGGRRNGPLVCGVVVVMRPRSKARALHGLLVERVEAAARGQKNGGRADRVPGARVPLYLRRCRRVNNEPRDRPR
jgi:hypothetical protein